MLNFENICLFYFVFGFLFIVLVSSSVRINKSGEILTRQQSETFKGIFIMLIFIHHFVIRMEEQGYLFPYNFVGYIAVAGFFLFSGYGLMCSYMNNKDYLNGFLRNKLLRLYIPTVVCTLIVGSFAVLVGYNNLNLGNIVYRSFTLRLITRFDFNWYVTATIIFYLIFFISLKFIKGRIAIASMFLLNFIYIAIGHFIGLGVWWINTALIFPLGVLIAYKKDFIQEILRRYYFRVLGIITILFVSTFIIASSNMFNYLIMSTLSGIFFAVLITTLSYKFTVKSKVFSLMGIISFELYLIHSQLFDIIDSAFNITSQLSWIIIFIIIIYIAYLLNRVTTILIKKVKRV